MLYQKDRPLTLEEEIDFSLPVNAADVRVPKPQEDGRGPLHWQLAWTVREANKLRLEFRGEVRRGYFVRGLSGAQFALPDAIEQLRNNPSEQEPMVVVMTAGPATVKGASKIVLDTGKVPLTAKSALDVEDAKGNAAVVPLFARSGEIAPFQTNSDPLLTAPDCNRVPAPGSISYQRSCVPAPPKTACAVHTAMVFPRPGSTAATAASKRPSSVSRR